MTAAEPPRIVEMWRYPEFAAATLMPRPADEDHPPPGPSAQERARLLALGIADRHTPETAVRRLIEHGEHAVAEIIIDDLSARLEQRRATRLADDAREARRADVVQISVRAQLLRDRAERAGLTDVDVAGLAALAANRRGAAEERLETLERDVHQAELTAVATIERQLRASLDPVPSGETLAWADQIAALLAAREIPAARRALLDGPGSSSLLPVDEPTAAWPWRTTPLGEVLGWFGDASPFAPPGVRDYPADGAGENLLAAMRALDDASHGDTAHGNAAHDAHTRLAAAVEELIGIEGLAPRLEPLAGGGSRATLKVPDDMRLPPMNFVGRAGLTITLGPEPPADGSAWLATRLYAEPRRDGAVISLADLLSLLQSEKPGSGRPRSVSSRRMGFIRAICRHLPLGAVVGPDAFAGIPRDELRRQVWWLLHAFGVSPDSVAVDTLLYESGAHPRLLVHTLHHVLEFARGEGYLRLDPAAFTALRGDVAYRDAVLAGLRGDLGDAPVAALCAAVFFASVDDLAAALDTVAADAGIEHPIDQLMSVDAAIAALRRAGHVLDDDAGRPTLCECGVTDLLRRGDPHEVAKEALRRLAGSQPSDRPETLEARLQEAEFQRYLLEMRVHEERDRARRAEAALDRVHSRTAEQIREDRDRREDRQQVAAWRAERVEIDLVEACQRVAKDVERYNEHVDVLVLAEPGRRIMVLGSHTALRISLRNIVGNAEQAALEAHPDSPATVAVRVAVDPHDATRAVVDVEDNGPGIPAAVLESFARGERPVSSRHEGDAVGLVGARVVLRLLGGDVEILSGGSAALGGAHVRLRVPLHRLDAAAEEPAGGS